MISYSVPSEIVAGTLSLETADREGGLRALAGRLGFEKVFFANQVHSGDVLTCGLNAAGEDGDAVICREPGTLLGVFTADCVPVLVYGPELTGFIHAGWRGFRKDIFRHFFSFLPVEAETLHCIIGPAICGGCYEIGPETAAFFHSPELARDAHGRFYLDLPVLARNHLMSGGIPAGHIYLSRECTCCGGMGLHSHRRNGTFLRNLSFVGRILS
ncbi:MAG: polyphenol oxidase family protein [Acidobacteria bacterium]|nr:polyphenol oxidase family protein [Acidobacteriota bacterium]